MYKPEGICIQGSKLSSAQAIINFVEVYMPNWALYDCMWERKNETQTLVA